MMMRIRCIPGHTQIGRVLAHARKEDDKQKLQALAFVGDCVRRSPPTCVLSPMNSGSATFGFSYSRRRETIATNVFLEIARRTKGAHCQFDLSSPGELAESCAPG